MQNGVFAEVEETEFDVNGLVCAGLRALLSKGQTWQVEKEPHGL